jgi:hypothetical protein
MKRGLLLLGALGCGFAAAISAAAAFPVAAPSLDGAVVEAASDCYAVGQRVAAQNGGQLAKAMPVTRGGKPSCLIVVLVPGKNGQRPRRAEIVVPQE